MELPEILEEACKNGDIAVVTDHFDRNENFVGSRSPNGETPLHWACTSGNIGLVRMVVGRGGSANAENWRGAAPLTYAAISGENSAISDFLLECGADPRKISGFSGQTPAGAAKSPKVRAKLLAAEGKINDAIRTDRQRKFRYRLSRWMCTSILYLCEPEHIRKQQFDPDYVLEPIVAKAYIESGVLVAWKICAAADRRIWAALPDTCLRCGAIGNPFCSDICEVTSRPVSDRLDE